MANVEYILDTFPDAEWTDEAEALAEEALSVREEAEALREERESLEDVDDPTVTDYQYAGVPEPWAHQKKAFLLSRDAESYALLMEQGTGKTKVAIDTAGHLFLRGEIDAVLIVAPNGVKSVWPEEFETHLPDYIEYDVRVWDSKLGKRRLRELGDWVKTADSETLKVFVVNVEGLSTKRAAKWTEDFLGFRRCLFVLDESTRIKTPGAKRTKKAVKLGKLAPYRRILTGTPVTKDPLDVYSQFRFLDENILGFGSFYAFRNHFAIMGGYEGREIIAFRNLDELKSLIDPFSFRVTEKECQDLPAKIYQRIEVDLTRRQKKLYRDMASDMVTEFDGRPVTVTIALTQMMRLQQIVGGFLPVFNEETDEYEPHAIKGANTKLRALLELADDYPGKMVVWSRFRPEIDLIEQALADEYGPESVVGYHGGVGTDDRTDNRQRFQDPDSWVRFLVGNPQTAGMGITLTAAPLAVYFSNSFDLEDRLQSEKRIHRAGQTSTVRYVDLVAGKTVDEKILYSLRDKKSLADVITEDNWTDWI